MREKLLNTIKEGRRICEEAEMDEEFLQRYRNLEAKLEDYKLPVPVVGDFSSGKSTLLNTFMGRDILATDITPETAIATEIKYGEKEKLVCYYLDKTAKDKEEFSLDKIDSLLASELEYIVLHLDLIKLNEYPDLYLVDMPGRDSSYENHNKAILQYLEQDVYYIVVTDVEHGGLKGSILKFIQDDLRGNDLNFSVLINKSDKKPPSQVEQIIDETKTRASAIAGKDVFVGRSSAIEDEIEDLEKIMDSIEVEDVIVAKFKGDLLELIKDSGQKLAASLQGQFHDSSEIDNKIMKLNQNIREIEFKLKEEEAEISRKFGMQTVDQVVADVKAALEGNIGMLSNAARSSNLENTVSDLVRPVISRSIKKYAAQVLQDSMDNIDNKLNDSLAQLEISSFNINDMGDIATAEDVDVGKSVGTAISGAVLGLVIPVGGLILAPIIGGLIGAIISLFGGSSKSQKVGPSIREQITNNVIPQVTNQVRPNINNALEEIKQNFMEQVRDKLGEKKNDLVSALEESKRRREESEAEFKNWIAGIKEAMNRLEELQVKLSKT